MEVYLSAEAFANMLWLHSAHICLEISTEGEINSVKGLGPFYAGTYFVFVFSFSVILLKDMNSCVS